MATPLAARRDNRKDLEETFAVRVVKKDSLAAVAASGDVVNAAGELDSEGTSHDSTLGPALASSSGGRGVVTLQAPV